MSIMTCNEFLNHIDEWIEGQEVPGARDHSRGCMDCRGLADELATIRLAGVTLSESDGQPPPQLWRNLRAQLESEGLIRSGTPARVETNAWFAAWFSAKSRPLLAGAYLAVLAVLGLALGQPGSVRRSHDAWLARTQNSRALLSAQLQDAEEDEVASLSTLSPALTEDLRKNLTIVDNDIALCEKSVREEPDNEIVRDYLYTAYQQKADLLAVISERGGNVR